MSRTNKSAATLLGVFPLFRELLGRKIYLLALLMPLSTLAESLGITLLLPLLAALDGGQVQGRGGGGLVRELLAWLPLPESALALLALIAFAFVLKALLKFATNAFCAFLQAKLAFRLKLALLDAYTHLRYSEYSKRNSGHYINVVNGQTNRCATVFHSFTHFLIQAAAAIVYLAFAALVNWQFALLAAVVGAVFMLAMKALVEYVRTLSRRRVQEQSTLNKQLVQVLHAMKYLVATNRAQHLAEGVRHSCRRLFGFQVRSSIAQAVASSAREPLSVVLVLGVVAVQIHFFQQPLGTILVALLLLHRTTQSLFSVQTGWQQTMTLLGSVEMVRDDLQFATGHREVRGTRKLDGFREAVEFRNVSFAYNAADGDVVQEVMLTIPRNRTVALVGHSGAGKSTLADLIALLHRPRIGSILIDGRDTRQLDTRTWRERIGYVCQETVVFDDTVAANICLNENAYRDDPDCRRRVHEAADRAFAAEFIETLPDAYETIVGDRGIRLSGGQRQRLFIARELYKQPELLILDEATSALDGASERAIQQSIEALRGRMTVVVIAHRLATIKNADYIYVLDNGEVIEEGPYEHLHSVVDSTFRRMVEVQSL